LVVTVLVCAVGCVGNQSPKESGWTVHESVDDESVDDDGGDEQPVVDRPVSDDPREVGTCVPSGPPIWDSLPDDEDAWLNPWYIPAPLEFSRDDGLLLQQPNRVFRSRDGAEFHIPGHTHGMDKSWTLALTGPDRDKVEVIDRERGETVMTFEVPGTDPALLSAELAASGTRAVGVACSDGETQLDVWSLVSGDHVASHSLGHRCDLTASSYGQVAPRIHISPDEKSVIAVLRSEGIVAHLDFDSGQIETRDLGQETSEEAGMRGMYPPPIVESALAPDGRRLLLSRGAGHVEIRDVPSFESTGISLPATVETLNEMTYMPPAWASPVAWAPSGDLFAMLGDSGDVEFRTLDGELVHTLSAVLAEDTKAWGMEDTAVALAYSHDGKKFVIGHYYGLSMWSCADAPTSPPPSIDDDAITLHLPTRVVTEEPLQIRVSVEGYPTAVTRVLIDGNNFLRAPTSPGTWEWFPYGREPGAHTTIRAEFDDGRTTGATEVTVEFQR
jgi:hypothetical protein